jgi:predicted nuclease with TOPRIM domain
MDEWVLLFKNNPLEAIGMVVLGGGYWLLKNRQEKAVDNREVERLKEALVVVIKERDEERERADEAFQKQLELTERFSEMRAQNERLLERMDAINKHVEYLTKQNTLLSEQVHRLQSSIDGVPK